MKTSQKKSGLALIMLLLIVTALFATSCGVRHTRCMSYYYDDVRRGLAH